jgi:hypothetical protein
MIKCLPVLLMFLLVLEAESLKAQVTTNSVGDNAVLKNFAIANPNYNFQGENKLKFDKQDSISLPFFDDFFNSSIYPDSTKWLNNQVFINNNFPIHPPTYNVATFDGLRPDGYPYNFTINKDFDIPGDSLISQPINLLFDTSGKAYALSDSIMLSFFYQPNGYGYHLSSEDSISVYFKAANGLWFEMWSVGGSKSADFKHVIIPIMDVNYLHGNFQFMFTTQTKAVGNANHWHIDYVSLDAKRSVTTDWYPDYAIQTAPVPILANYFSMPYDHVTVNAAAQTYNGIALRVSNLYNVGKAINAEIQDTFNGVEIYNSLLGSGTGANNVAAYGSLLRNMPGYSLPSLGGSEPLVINRTTNINEEGLGAGDKNKANNVLKSTQIFHDYYSYDDGSAERGFGFDQNTNPNNIEAQIAYGFDITKKDTLYAISTFFNQAVYDVSTRGFRYRIWSALKGVNGASADLLLYESELTQPVYSSQNGQRTFHSHILDTLLVVNAGTYYIGWWQPNIFNLNVGWDMNFGNTRNPDRTNPKLYYQSIGDWSNSDLPNGTLMMRPYFGSKRDLNASLHQLATSKDRVTVYPNPASSQVNLGEDYAIVQLVSLSGEVVQNYRDVSSFNLSGVLPGVYFVRLTNKRDELFTAKLVIIAP